MALNQNQKSIVGIAAGAAVLGMAGSAAFIFRREIKSFLFGTPIVEPAVEAKLPIAKTLKTVADYEGNYDIDGVSYDVEGTIVSSDDSKHFRDYSADSNR